MGFDTIEINLGLFLLLLFIIILFFWFLLLLAVLILFSFVINKCLSCTFMSNSTTVELRLRSDWVVTINYCFLAPEKLGKQRRQKSKQSLHSGVADTPHPPSGPVIWFGNISSKPQLNHNSTPPTPYITFSWVRHNKNN